MSSKTYILEYDYIEGILEKRTPFRPEHINLAKDFVNNKHIKAGGPYADASGALFVFQVEDDALVHEFVNADPYVSAGLVTSHRVRELTVGVGGLD
mgnify:CR=1 FL=1|jgi:uncharacterized protein